MEIAKSKMIKPTKDGWLVKSQSSDNCYKVAEEFVCNCPDPETREVFTVLSQAEQRGKHLCGHQKEVRRNPEIQEQGSPRE
jgi:hypothetical protein